MRSSMHSNECMENKRDPHSIHFMSIGPSFVHRLNKCLKSLKDFDFSFSEN